MILFQTAVKCLHFEIILRSDIEAVHIKSGLAVNDIAVIKFVRLYAIADHISVSSRDRTPEKVCLAPVFRIAHHLHIIHLGS